MSEIEELKKQIAGLQARIGELEGDEPKATPDAPKTFVDPFGIERKITGEQVINGQTESIEDRQRQRVERMDAAIAEEVRKATEGCPEGYGRDPFGRVKRISIGPDGTMIFGAPYRELDPTPNVAGGFNPAEDG